MKAILVIDTDNCWDCPLERDEKCQYSHRKIAKNNMPSWCPLKPIPQKKEEGYPNDDYTIGKADGWDACIDEILGEENDNN